MQHTDPILAFWLPICSLIVAALALVVAPFVNWLVARRQMQTSLAVAQKQVIAPMRQKWIDSLRDRVAEFVSTAHWRYVSGGDQVVPLPDDDEKFEEHESMQLQHVERKLIFMLNQIELMLNSKEEDHIVLMQALRGLARSCSGHEMNISEEMTHVRNSCKVVLKREWDRLKKEA